MLLKQTQFFFSIRRHTIWTWQCIYYVCIEVSKTIAFLKFSCRKTSWRKGSRVLFDCLSYEPTLYTSKNHRKKHLQKSSKVEKMCIWVCNPSWNATVEHQALLILMLTKLCAKKANLTVCSFRGGGKLMLPGLQWLQAEFHPVLHLPMSGQWLLTSHETRVTSSIRETRFSRVMETRVIHWSPMTEWTNSWKQQLRKHQTFPQLHFKLQPRVGNRKKKSSLQP